MSEFAFSTIEPNRGGFLERPEIPLGRFLGAAWDQGVHDSMGGSLYRISEQFQLEHDISALGFLDQQAGRTLSADEANAQYGDQRLRFTEPVNEGTARLLRERQDEQSRRNYLLSAGASSAGRVAASFGVSMLASLANPLDFSLMFFPIVGAEGTAARVGGGALRQGLARGLITEERLAARLGTTGAKLAGAAVEGTVGQAVAEIPLFISNSMDQTPYTVSDSLTNIALGGAFATGFRLALTGAGRLFKKLSPDTREAAFHKAASDFLNGKDVEVHKLVELDEAAIRERVVFDATAARARALSMVDEKLLFEEAWARARLDVEGSAGKVDQPNLIKIAEEWIPIFEQQGKDTALLKKLLEAAKESSPETMSLGELKRVLETGRPSSSAVLNLQNLASQLNLEFDPLERTFPAAYYIAPDPERRRLQKIAGVSDEDLARPGEISNERRRQQVQELQMQKELQVRQAVEKEKERRVKEYLEQLRREFDPEQETRRRVNEEIQRQQKEGKVLSDEQVAKYKNKSISDESDITVLERDVEQLKKDLGEDDIPFEESGDKSVVDRVIASLESLKRPVDENVRYSGVPIEVWNALVDFVIAGVKSGKALVDAIEEALTANRPNRQLDTSEAFDLLVSWAESGTKKVSFQDVASATRSLERFAIPAKVYRATRSEHSRGIAGWSVNPEKAKEFGDRSGMRENDLITIDAKKVLTHERLLEIAHELDKIDLLEENAQTFLIEEEAFVLDFLLTGKQVDDLRARLYDNLDLNPIDDGRDLSPMLTGSVLLDHLRDCIIK